ncbi:hypothetical protein DEIPH_ctg079orf0013 [Deinococcus phoenicis]|uniref:FlgD Ig-like domain-containing protein n=1 Tax=Deinococcus phoenicis TaxID=1476583 RepID=A0A016QKQ9_9DEIO|nr:hypothetical protein [Deinococcus phoenicis]EYB66633.1 hypothetical protein DEIPH_ctg079orf0013 [Deinococcus phoenicis]
MNRLLPLLILTLCATAHADPNAPLIFQLQPTQYHAYRNDPPPPLTLTLTLQNPTAQAVPLKCLAVGAPVLKRFTAYQNGQAVNRLEQLGQLAPVGNAPTCREVGEVLAVPARTTSTYTRALGPQKVGAQVEYVAGWNVSLRPGFGWLQRASASALVVPEDRPIPTPHPRAYQDALDASHAEWQTRTSRDVPADQRLSFRLADQVSRQAFLAELKKRGLDAGKIDIEVAPPVRLPTRPGFAHAAQVVVLPTNKGYTFALKVTNRTGGPLKVYQAVCEPLALERVSGGLRVWQVGNGPCPAMAPAALLLQPGQSTTREARWDGTNSVGQRVPTGQYRVRMGLGQFVGEAVFTVK